MNNETKEKDIYVNEKGGGGAEFVQIGLAMRASIVGAPLAPPAILPGPEAGLPFILSKNLCCAGEVLC